MDRIEKEQMSVDLSQYDIQIIAKAVKLELKRSFNTAHSSSTTRTNFIIKSFLQTPSFTHLQQNINALEKSEAPSISVGYGECGLPPKKPYCYLADINDCEAFMKSMMTELRGFQNQFKEAPLDRNLFLEFLKMLFSQVFGQLLLSLTQSSQLIFFSSKFNSLVNSAKDNQSILEVYFYMQVLFLLCKSKQFSAIHNEYKAARSALQFSILDLIGTIQNKSVSQIICGKQDYIQQNVNYSFYTISHEQDLQSMLQNGKESLKFTNCIKIKFNNQVNKLIELLIMMDIEQIGSKWIIDANASWTPNDYLQFQSMLLQHCGQNHSIRHKLLFIQQPFPIFKSLNSLKTTQQIQTEQNAWQKIKQNTSMIIIADESFASFDDLQSVLKYSHGINIKMEKCGGPLEAIKTLKQAQKRQIQHVMFGSMVSTHLGCNQTFQFYQFAQYFDIDGALLVKQPEINGGFEWRGSSGIIKVNGKGLALDKGDIQKLF